MTSQQAETWDSIGISCTIFLYHDYLFRHGVMIVGDPMSAKTKAYMLLAETLTTMSERKIPEHHEFRVRGRSQLHMLIETQNTKSFECETICNNIHQCSEVSLNSHA